MDIALLTSPLALSLSQIPWKQRIDEAAFDASQKNTATTHVGIRFVSQSDCGLTLSMNVDNRTIQPFGILNGGMSVLLAETAGSAAANLCVDFATTYCVGQEIRANHLRSVRSGKVFATAEAIHLGYRSQLWQIAIRNDAGTLICIASLTMAVIQRTMEGNIK